MIFGLIIELWSRGGERVPCTGGDIPGVFCLGTAHDADHCGTERDVSGSHVPDERSHNGDQGHTIVSVGPADRRPLRRLGPQVFPPHYGRVHLCPHPPYEHQHLVVFCYDLHQRRLRLHILCCFCLRCWRHRGKSTVPCLWLGKKYKLILQILLIS